MFPNPQIFDRLWRQTSVWLWTVGTWRPDCLSTWRSTPRYQLDQMSSSYWWAETPVWPSPSPELQPGQKQMWEYSNKKKKTNEIIRMLPSSSIWNSKPFFLKISMFSMRMFSLTAVSWSFWGLQIHKKHNFIYCHNWSLRFDVVP